MATIHDGNGKAIDSNNPLYVTSSGVSELFGNAADVKPTNVKKGSTFFAIDTKAVYMFNGSTWVVI